MAKGREHGREEEGEKVGKEEGDGRIAGEIRRGREVDRRETDEEKVGWRSTAPIVILPRAMNDSGQSQEDLY